LAYSQSTKASAGVTVGVGWSLGVVIRSYGIGFHPGGTRSTVFTFVLLVTRSVMDLGERPEGAPPFRRKKSQQGKQPPPPPISSRSGSATVDATKMGISCGGMGHFGPMSKYVYNHQIATNRSNMSSFIAIPGPKKVGYIFQIHNFRHLWVNFITIAQLLPDKCWFPLLFTSDLKIVILLLEFDCLLISFSPLPNITHWIFYELKVLTLYFSLFQSFYFPVCINFT